MRTLPCTPLVAIALLLASLALPSEAHAQVSDADRAAARELYFKGAELQNAGKFAEALDRFQKAQKVFPAPTTLLHVAECQVALGRLVAGQESYRALVNAQLPPGSPPAYSQAQAQGKAELAQVEPLVPELTTSTAPDKVIGVQVTIDDAPIPEALLGEPRPVDPGTHLVAASAPGYNRVEKQIDVAKGDKKSITLALTKNDSGITYGPGVNLPAGAGTSGAGASGAGTSAPAPAPYGGEPVAAPRPSAPSRTGILLGFRLGVAIPAGSLPNDAPQLASTVDLGSVAGAGVEGDLEAYLRFARHFLVGGQLEGTSLGGKSVATLRGDTAPTSVSSALYMVKAGYLSNPDGVGVLLDLGLGQRRLSFTENQPYFSQRRSALPDQSYSGFEGMVGVGLHLRASKGIRFLPKAEASAGSFTTDSGASASHLVVMLSVAMFFNLDFHSDAPAGPPAQARSATEVVAF